MARSLRRFLSLARNLHTTITAIGSTVNLESKVCWSGNKHQLQSQITRGLTTSSYLNRATEVLHPDGIYKCRAAIIECLEEKNSTKRLAMEKDLWNKVQQILDIKQSTSGDLAFAFLAQVRKCLGQEIRVRCLLSDLFLNGVTYRIRFVTTLWNCLKMYSSRRDGKFSYNVGRQGRLTYRFAFAPLPAITGARPLKDVLPLLITIHATPHIQKLFEDALVAAKGPEIHVITEMLRRYSAEREFYRTDRVFDAMEFIRHCIVHPPAGILEKDMINGLHVVFHPIYPMVQRFDYANRHLDFISPLRFTGVWDY